ncbi:hypothetical protein TNIN_151181 [Trichonephila inaurata madagascariensis]|uniref:Uncharacterized protein n=1 Tax=Trichonephila inaurata madagascariensis TaxID=2747483 RepID=A0A8X7CAU5_9ARAC|nr:hypothetical protein TNIN_151181 [Trichonephila inaurata madagascariensis]
MGLAINPVNRKVKPPRWGKKAQTIELDVLKSPTKGCGGPNGPRDFCTLWHGMQHRVLFPIPFQHGRPDEAVLDEALCGTNTWRENYGRTKYLKSEVPLAKRPIFSY